MAKLIASPHHCLPRSVEGLSSESLALVAVQTAGSTAGGRAQPTARMLSVSTGGTSVSDSTLRVSVLSLEMREMVGCWAGVRLGDKFEVSTSKFLPGFLERLVEELSTTDNCVTDDAGGCSGTTESSVKKVIETRKIQSYYCARSLGLAKSRFLMSSGCLAGDIWVQNLSSDCLMLLPLHNTGVKRKYDYDGPERLLEWCHCAMKLIPELVIFYAECSCGRSSPQAKNSGSTERPRRWLRVRGGKNIWRGEIPLKTFLRDMRERSLLATQGYPSVWLLGAGLTRPFLAYPSVNCTVPQLFPALDFSCLTHTGTGYAECCCCPVKPHNVSREGVKTPSLCHSDISR